MSAQNIAIAGPGSIVYGIAQSLVCAGHTVQGDDINSLTMDRFVAEALREYGQENSAQAFERFFAEIACLCTAAGTK